MRQETLEKLINDPRYRDHLIQFSQGDVLCIEGDDSQDLCILVSGVLEVFKGGTKIQEIDRPGSIIGEISYLLGVRRPATVRARSDGKALIIPKERVPEFLDACPDVLWQIPRTLARRVEEVSQVLYGMKQLCDQLPDAVVITDSEGKIISWNKRAEDLYGRDWDKMHHAPAREIYEDKSEFDSLLNITLSSGEAQEKALTVRHPEKGQVVVSTRANLLYDAQHKLQGIVLVGREVTNSFGRPVKHGGPRRLFITLVISSIVVAIGIALLYWVLLRSPTPTLKTDVHLQQLIQRDRDAVESMLGDLVARRDMVAISKALAEFVNRQLKNHPGLYRDIVVLDDAKGVIGSLSTVQQNAVSPSIGTKYSNINFYKAPGSTHYILIFYQKDKQHPMGRKCVAIGFRIKRKGQQVGWLIFQMNMKFLKNHYGVNESSLRRLKFRSLQGN